MKLVLSIAIVIFSVNNSYSQSNEYKDLKTGVFTYEGRESVSRVIRTKRKQIEIWNEGKSKLILKIKWISDTEYTLTLKKRINAPGCLSRGDTVYTKITGKDGEKYTFKSKSTSCGPAEGVIIKL